MEKKEKFSLRPYYTFKLPLLGLMALIAVIGITLTLLLYFLL